MNQGLAVHIITTLIYIGIVSYILDGEQTSMSMRALIVGIGIFTNIVVAMICGGFNLYNKKTQ